MTRAYLALEDTQSTNKSYLKSIRTYTAATAAAIETGSDYVVSAAYKITAGVASATLVSLASISNFPSDLVRIAIVKFAAETADNILFKIGGAAIVATSPEWPSGGLSAPLTASVADTIQVIRSGAADVDATLLVMTPR